MRNISVFIVLAVSMLQFSCGGGGGSAAGQQDRGTPALFLAVKNTTPAFTATVSAAPKMKSGIYSAPSFSSMDMNLAFQLLRDYSFPADEGKIDMTNIYKVLFEAGGYLDDAPTLCSTMTPTLDSVISSYVFSEFLEHTYNCGGTRAESNDGNALNDPKAYGRSVAYKEVGNDKYMLATYKWAPDPAQQIAIGAIQTHFNSSTNDVELTFAQTVNYPIDSDMGGATGSGFVTRTTITGNSATHAFTLKIAMGDGKGTGQALVGKGVSQGIGNYFLMRNGLNYYCVPAGATESTLSSMTSTTQGGVSANCSAYVADVAAMVPFDVTDFSQVPRLDLSSFNLGVAGTPRKYLMFPE